MQRERWREVEELFESAVSRPPEERAVFLDQACGEDEELRREIESLLKADASATGFLERDVAPAPRTSPIFSPASRTRSADATCWTASSAGAG